MLQATTSFIIGAGSRIKNGSALQAILKQLNKLSAGQDKLEACQEELEKGLHAGQDEPKMT
jgi:hypothetical protein